MIETSGHDRLLAAADICEQPYAFSGFKEPDPFAVALAALLRAVADRDTPGKSEEWKVAQRDTPRGRPQVRMCRRLRNARLVRRG